METENGKTLEREMEYEENTINIPLVDKLKLLTKQLIDHTRDPMCPQNSFLENLKEGFEMYPYYVEEKMTEKSINLPKARWDYNKKIGLFINRDNGDDRLALKIPKNGHGKYIYAEMNSGKNIVAAFPYDLHKGIVEKVEELTGDSLYNISGGHLSISTKKNSNPQITIYGSSVDYSKANHEEVAELLNKHGLETILKQNGK